MRLSSSKLWFMFTVIIGLVTSLIVTNYLRGLENTIAKEAKTGVVVASTKIEQGTLITSEMVKLVSLPNDYVPENRVQDINQVVNKFSTVDLWPEDPIIMDKLATQNTSSELPYKIPKGHRAYTTAVTPITGVAGHIKPGHYVDILLSFTKKTKTEPQPKDMKVVVMLQNVLVLAVGPDLTKKEGIQAAENLTLALTTKNAQLLMLAESTGGKIKFILKPSGDKENVKTSPENLEALQGMYK